MTTQITWVIEQMQCAVQQDGQTDVVITAAWRCNGVDGDYAATVCGSCGFTYDGSSFTSYDQLAQDQVLGWCWSNGVDKNDVEVDIQQQIQRQVSPSVVTLPLPWVV